MLETAASCAPVAPIQMSLIKNCKRAMNKGIFVEGFYERQCDIREVPKIFAGSRIFSRRESNLLLNFVILTFRHTPYRTRSRFPPQPHKFINSQIYIYDPGSTLFIATVTIGIYL